MNIDPTFSPQNNINPLAGEHGRRSVHVCWHADPERRLVAAIVLQAVKDAHFPIRSTDNACIDDAKQFLASDTGREMLVSALGKN